MSYAFTPIAVPYLIALILAGFISVYSFVFFERTNKTNILFIGFTSSLTIWTLGTLMQILATTRELMIFWEYCSIIGIDLASIFFLLFAFSFTHFAPRIFSKPLNIIVFGIPFLFDIFFLLTNEYHLLYFEELFVHPTAPFPTLYRVNGILYYLHFSLIALFLGVGSFIFLMVYRITVQPTYRRQIQLILFGILILAFVGFLYQLRITPLTEYLDITPLGSIVTSVLIMFGIRGYHLIDIIPIAHQVIIANLTNTGVIATDKNKRIIEINPKAREYLFPTYTQKIIGKELIPLLHTQEHLESQIFDEIQQIEQIFLHLDSEPNISKSFEIEMITPLDTERKVLKIVVETLQEREKPIGTIFFLLDITAEKEIQEAERKREDLRDSLLGVISHDLKNELFVITGFTEVIREELEKLENQQELVEFLEGIDAKVEKAASIITDVRSYLKTVGAFDTTISPTKIDVRKVLTSSLAGFDELIDNKKLILNTEFYRDEVFILADLRIQSVFTNILDNAIKWSPDGGTINISIDEQDHFWVIKITDQGSGVPDELKKAIFKPFTAFGKEKSTIGSGLGLALVSEILSHYNGSIWVEDNVPTGACFCVKMPFYREIT